MPKINKEWVTEQLQAAKVKIGSGKAILKLLEAWEEIPELSSSMTEEVMSVFPALARGYALKQEDSEENYTWVPLNPGEIKVADIVRVKSDAFQDKLGPLHNGRRGVVVAVRYGDVIVNSTDGKSPDLKGVHYSPYKLEKRVKRINR